MKIDMHFYANGNDPFIFPLGDFIVHVHAGAPPQESSTVPGPDLAYGLTPPPGQTPTLTVSPNPEPIPTPTSVPLPYGLTHIHGADEIRGWFSEAQLESGDQPVRFRLDTVSGPSRPEIQSLVQGLQGLSGRDVSVDIVGWSQTGDG